MTGERLMLCEEEGEGLTQPGEVREGSEEVTFQLDLKG